MYDTKTALRAAYVEMYEIANSIDEDALFTEDAETVELCFAFDALHQSALENRSFMEDKTVGYLWTTEGKKYDAISELVRELDNKLARRIGQEKMDNILLGARYGEAVLARMMDEEAE